MIKKFLIQTYRLFGYNPSNLLVIGVLIGFLIMISLPTDYVGRSIAIFIFSVMLFMVGFLNIKQRQVPSFIFPIEGIPAIVCGFILATTGICLAVLDIFYFVKYWPH